MDHGGVIKGLSVRVSLENNMLRRLVLPKVPELEAPGEELN
jgi:hypothetical protein